MKPQLRPLGIASSSLSLIQAVIWIVLTSIAISAYTCAIGLDSKEGSEFTSYVAGYFEKTTCKDAGLYKCFDVTKPGTIVIWMSVALVVNVSLLIASIGLLTVLTKRLRQGIIVKWMWFYIVSLVIVLIIDVCLTAMFAIDADASAVKCDVPPDQELASSALISMSIIASKGGILWITDLSFVITFIYFLLSKKNGYERRPIRKSQSRSNRESPSAESNTSQPTVVSTDSFVQPLYLIDQDLNRPIGEVQLRRPANPPPHSAQARWPSQPSYLREHSTTPEPKKYPKESRYPNKPTYATQQQSKAADRFNSLFAEQPQVFNTEQPQGRYLEETPDRYTEQPQGRFLEQTPVRYPEQPLDKTLERSQGRYQVQPQERYPEQPQGRFSEPPQGRYPGRSLEQPQGRYSEQPQRRYPEQPQGRFSEQPQGRNFEQARDRNPEQAQERNIEQAAGRKQPQYLEQLQKRFGEQPRNKPSEQSPIRGQEQFVPVLPTNVVLQRQPSYIPRMSASSDDRIRPKGPPMPPAKPPLKFNLPGPPPSDDNRPMSLETAIKTVKLKPSPKRPALY